MILIDDIEVSNVNVKFYNGVDFDVMMEHPKDGSAGFIFCFIESWISEVKSYNRQRKLDSVVDNINYSKFEWEEIDNNYISVYQTEGMDIHSVYKAIRTKVERKQFDHQKWTPIAGLSRGAWKIEVGKNDD